jgi:hypothetical protein
MTDPTARPMRCAVYTRKSTEHNLEGQHQLRRPSFPRETDCMPGHIEVAPTNVFNDLRVKRVPEVTLFPLMFLARCQKDPTPKAFPARLTNLGERASGMLGGSGAWRGCGGARTGGAVG